MAVGLIFGRRRKQVMDLGAFNPLGRVQVLLSNILSYVNKISHAVQTEPPNQFCGGIIADPMGLGKTLTMIALIASDTDNSFETRRLLREESHISFPRFKKYLTLIVVPLSCKSRPRLISALDSNTS
jgi:SNF2 family DNA or RNA helicase